MTETPRCSGPAFPRWLFWLPLSAWLGTRLAARLERRDRRSAWLVTVLFLASLFALLGYMLVGLIAPEQLPAGWVEKWGSVWYVDSREVAQLLAMGAAFLLLWLPLSGWLGAKTTLAVMHWQGWRGRIGNVALILPLLLPQTIYIAVVGLAIAPALYFVGLIDSPILHIVAFVAGNLIPTASFVALVVVPFLRRSMPDSEATAPLPVRQAVRLRWGVPERLFTLSMAAAVLFGVVRFSIELEMMAWHHWGPRVVTLEYAMLWTATSFSEFFFLDYYLGVAAALLVVPGLMEFLRPLLTKPERLDLKS